MSRDKTKRFFGIFGLPLQFLTIKRQRKWFSLVFFWFVVKERFFPIQNINSVFVLCFFFDFNNLNPKEKPKKQLNKTKKYSWQYFQELKQKQRQKSQRQSFNFIDIWAAMKFAEIRQPFFLSRIHSQTWHLSQTKQQQTQAEKLPVFWRKRSPRQCKSKSNSQFVFCCCFEIIPKKTVNCIGFRSRLLLDIFLFELRALGNISWNSCKSPAFSHTKKFGQTKKGIELTLCKVRILCQKERKWVFNPITNARKIHSFIFVWSFVRIFLPRKLFTQQKKLKKLKWSSNHQRKQKRVYFSCICCWAQKTFAFVLTQNIFTFVWIFLDQRFWLTKIKKVSLVSVLTRWSLFSKSFVFLHSVFGFFFCSTAPEWK